MKRLGVKDEPYPDTAGRCTVLENKRSGEITVLVTISEKASERSAVEVIGLLVHEGTHVWQQIKRDIGEDNPSPEFEAYSMQAITQGRSKPIRKREDHSMATGDVRTVSFTWLSVILKAEPEFYAKRKDERLYEWSNGREFRGDPRRVGTAYPDE
ncbi:hypothetical protein J1C56_02005 [Aminobacter anthyllidis]|uniref:Uncharacterized protein n=1 Tax=Aminobacter anthyllidis TaxID=1035067 RepID=A0A9X1A6U9_9HYPH|nr:hypothetical protein [Aminobacter anthyllidis]MBT1154358.1 hypothetical protein [Aminobacter anthyllidis]